jgi:hypothetical protein
MKETLITFETAKLVKEKGFDIGVNQSYIIYKESYNYDDDPNHRESYKIDDIQINSHYHVNNYKGIDLSNEFYEAYSAPTQSLLQRWLREVHNIFVEVNTDCTSAPKFSFDIKQFVGNPKDLSDKEWDWVFPIQNENWGLDRTYEISLEAGLQEGLKLVKYEMVK